MDIREKIITILERRGWTENGFNVIPTDLFPEIADQILALFDENCKYGKDRRETTNIE